MPFGTGAPDEYSGVSHSMRRLALKSCSVSMIGSSGIAAFQVWWLCKFQPEDAIGTIIPNNCHITAKHDLAVYMTMPL